MKESLRDVKGRKSEKSGQLSLLLNLLALLCLTSFGFSTFLVVLDIFVIHGESLINFVAKSGLVFDAGKRLV
jgi:hypothetical protein